MGAQSRCSKGPIYCLELSASLLWSQEHARWCNFHTSNELSPTSRWPRYICLGCECPSTIVEAYSQLSCHLQLLQIVPREERYGHGAPRQEASSGEPLIALPDLGYLLHAYTSQTVL